jgi:hypothetical protein
MVRSRHFRGAAPLALGAILVGALGACADDAELLAPQPAVGAGAPYLERAVWLGDSFAMGIQSYGLNETTQRSAYPALIMRAAGVPYAAAYLTGPGCAPFADWLNAFLAIMQQPTTPARSGPCVRTPETAGLALLNNVAVSGANSAQPARQPGAGESAALGVLTLGGRTQVEAALAMNPTFVELGVNNDVLQAAFAGDTTSPSTAMTPVATFQANMDAAIDRLTQGAAARKGLLVGAVEPTNLAMFIPVAAIFPANAADSAYRVMLQRALLGGRPIRNVNCAPNTTAAISPLLLLQFARVPAAQLPAIPLACSPVTVAGQALGGILVLDAGERTAIAARVAGYNAYLRGKAASLGWAYYDPNASLQRLRQQGLINPAPLFVNTATGLAIANPWGEAVSLDGAHPSARGQMELANDVIKILNEFYRSTIPAATIGPSP